MLTEALESCRGRSVDCYMRKCIWNDLVQRNVDGTKSHLLLLVMSIEHAHPDCAAKLDELFELICAESGKVFDVSDENQGGSHQTYRNHLCARDS